MSAVIEAVEPNATGIMILTPEESELFLDMATNNPQVVHDAECLYYYTPAEIMVMVDKKVYKEYEQRRISSV